MTTSEPDPRTDGWSWSRSEPTMSDPDPTLADRLDRWAEIADAAMIDDGGLHRAAAVRLREQDAEIENLKAANALAVGHLVHVDDLPELTRPPHPHSASLFMAGMLAQRERDAARLRKLDRIEAALGDVWIANEIRWAVGDGRVVKMAYHPLDEMLRRLADALEDPGTDG